MSGDRIHLAIAQLEEEARVIAESLDSLRHIAKLRTAPVLPLPALSAPPLTAREQQVVDLVVEGKTNKEIAAALGLSARTAKFHLGNIFLKYGMQGRGRGELTAMLLRAN